MLRHHLLTLRKDETVGVGRLRCVQRNVILPLTAFHVEGSSKVLDICRSGHCVVLRELKRSPLAEFRAVSKQYSHASLKDGATF